MKKFLERLDGACSIFIVVSAGLIGYAWSLGTLHELWFQSDGKSVFDSCHEFAGNTYAGEAFSWCLNQFDAWRVDTPEYVDDMFEGAVCFSLVVFAILVVVGIHMFVRNKVAASVALLVLACASFGCVSWCMSAFSGDVGYEMFGDKFIAGGVEMPEQVYDAIFNAFAGVACVSLVATAVLAAFGLFHVCKFLKD